MFRAVGDELDRQDVEAALLRRVEEALEAGERVRGNSEVRDVVASGLVARCAWCGRFRVDGEWVVAVRERQADGREDATHGICESCVEALRETGMSF